MTEYAKLVISVDSRPVAKADTDLKRLTQTATKTEQATDGLGSAFRRLAGPLAAVISARQIAQAAESYTNLTNRLKLVTDSTEELVAAQEAVFALAQDARQPLDATAELYQRIATNADALGLSASGVAAVVDTVNKSLAISGTTAQAASGALTQLGQAFASGQLRGEELNAVLENAPALAKALADGLGVTVGELRELGKAGELSADQVVQALLRQGAAVNEQFGEIQATAGQAFTVLGNSLTRAVGEIDAATGASSALAEGILDLSRLIDSGALTTPIIQGFAIWSATFDAASDDIEGLGYDLEFLGVTGQNTAEFIGTAFKQMPANLRAAVQIATVEVVSLFDRAATRAAGAAAEIVTFLKFGSDAAAKVAAQNAQDLANLNQVRNESLDGILAERDAIIQAGEAAKQKYLEEQAARNKNKEEREKEIAELRAQAQARGRAVGGASGGDTTKAAREAEKAAQRLTDLYATNEEQLQRQLALFGQTTEAARIRYETENGDLSQLNAQQQERLALLAAEIDRVTQRKELEDEVSRIREASLTEEQRANKEIQQDYTKINAAYEQGILSEKEWRQATLDRADAYARAAEDGKKSSEELDEFAKNAIQSFQGELSGTIKDTLTGDFDDIGKRWLELLQQMAADAFAAEITRGIFGDKAQGGEGGLLTSLAGLFTGGGGASTGSGGASTATGLLSLFSSFAGFFDRGGAIPAGGFGIVGENGPEIVRGPANVTGREETAAQMGRSVTVGQMVFPNVTNAREAREASAVAARNIARLAQGSARYT